MSKPTTQERYIRASQTSDLSINLIAPSDADQLIAAGFASARRPKRILALKLHRMMAAGQVVGARDLSYDLGAMLRTRMIRARAGTRAGGVPNLAETAKMAMLVIKWMRHPTCPSCHGRGHPSIPGTPHLDTSRVCAECHGSGQRPVERLVRTEYAEDVRWLVSEIEATVRQTFDAMRRITR